MADAGGGDETSFAVPVDALHPIYEGVINHTDLPPLITRQIEHFFQHYKDLEKGKWDRVGHWLDAEGAARMIVEAIERAGK